MKNAKLFVALLACSLILFNACKKDPGTEGVAVPKDLLVAKKADHSAKLRERLNKLVASLPADRQKKFKQKSKLLLDAHPGYRDMIDKILGVEATKCDANTPSNQWLDQQLADWDNEIIENVLATAMLDLPAYDALIFENSSDNQYFGANGEYTQRVTKTFRDLKRFWDIQSEGIVLTGMHGGMLADRDKLIRTYAAAFILTPEEVEFYADYVLLLLQVFPELRNGNHPIFTFNAFAQRSFDFEPYGIIPNKIVMGDGVLEAFTAIGFGDVAPQAVLAHEFGHHIQFQLDLFEPVSSPEATRRTELMADAYAAYYLSHARGASMQWKRVKQFLQVFFNIGDCSFTSEGHHGTPTQRMAAAEWGYSIANEAQKQGHILTSQEFTLLFESKLPELVML